MVFTSAVTYLRQILGCVTPGKTLHLRYRSGWTDAPGVVGVYIARIQPSGFDRQDTVFIASQTTWLSQDIPITITATEIELGFSVSIDTTQWLDIDDVYID